MALLALVTALGCSPEGETREPSRERLLSIGADLSRVVAALGAGPQVVATDAISLATVPELGHAIDVGDPDAPSPEAARRAAPERVLVLGEASSPAAILARELEAEGIPATVLSPRDADEVIAAIRRLGRIVGRELRATAVASRQTREVAALATRRDGLPRLRAIWVLERAPLVVVGGAGLHHQLLELAGAENAFHGDAAPRLTIPDEALLDTPADVVIGAPPLPDLPDGTPVSRIALDPALAELPLLDLPGRVRALHDALYPSAAR